MCSNYEPVTSQDRLLACFGAKAEAEPPQVEAWPQDLQRPRETVAEKPSFRQAWKAG